MLENIIKIGLRNLRRNKVFSLLNIMGLAIGLTASILIMLYSFHELGYDAFHEDADRIHRVTMSFRNGDSYTTTTTTPWRIGPMLQDNFPQVESIFRMQYTFNTNREAIYGEQRINIQDNYTFAEANLFDFFTFRLRAGNPETALANPGGVVISESEARKLFGDQDPMGKTITVRAIYDEYEFTATVTGVMEDIPTNSHFHYSYYFPLIELEEAAPNMKESWGWTSQNTYIKLREGDVVAPSEEQMVEVIKANAPEWYQEWAYLGTQPMLDIHLNSHLKEELEPTGDATYIRLLLIIALFIISIASINYMNLATSLATGRAKEVGIRKAIGAVKRQLILQFLFESILTTVIAAVLAVTLVQLTLPYFNDLTSRSLTLFGQPWQALATGGGIILLLGVISGVYPAFFLSSFKTIRTLKGGAAKAGTGSQALRRGLVVTQFVISSFLICATLIILQQWDYLRNRSLGLDTGQVISIDLGSEAAIRNYAVLRNELLAQSNVLSVGGCSKSATGRYDGFSSFGANGESFSIPLEGVDEHFFSSLNITFLEGRNFSSDFPSDSNAVIVNRQVLTDMGIENPLETPVTVGNDAYHIIGVVDDFHFEPLYAELGPVVFANRENWLRYAYVKVGPGDLSNTLRGIEDSWREINPTTAFNMTFVDDEIQRAYATEKDFFYVFTIFSGLAIFIACLGLFGLASFTVSQNIKEIGIRKALGATSSSIAMLYTTKFTLLVVIANVIAWPIAYFVMGDWLQKFPYRIDIGLWVFAIAGILSVVIALLSVSSHSLRASKLNPVTSLRYE